MRRPKSIKYSLCSLLFIIVHHSRFLLLVTVILINLTIPKSITISYSLLSLSESSSSLSQYSRKEVYVLTGRKRRFHRRSVRWEDQGAPYSLGGRHKGRTIITNTKTYRRILLFIIIAQNEKLPFGSLEFHNKKDNQIINHNKGKSIQIKQGKKKK